MLADLTYLIVEDKAKEATTLAEQLVAQGLDPGKCSMARTASGARSEISSGGGNVDLVFLDLAIPDIDEKSVPDADHGHALLRWIHDDWNARHARRIRVAIVSGQYLLSGVLDEELRKRYEGTLIGIVIKGRPEMLADCLAAVADDPLLDKLIGLRVGVDAEYRTIVDPASPVEKKCKAAIQLACRLVMNEGDYRRGALGTCRYGDKLHLAIKEVIEARFKPPADNLPRVRKSNMISGEAWGHFLWRGAMVDHLYGINHYRNRNLHIADHDYVSEDPTTDEWNPPNDVLQHFRSGADLAVIVREQVRALVKWYLPWHEQVYLPWFKAQTSGGSGR
jgi:CheY-like chemotaxis protein